VSEPLFHVKRGHPTAEELAALTAVLAAKLRAATAARSRRHSAGPPPWGAPAAAHRRPLPAPGPGAWKRAAWVGALGGAGVGALGGAGVGGLGGGEVGAVGAGGMVGGVGNEVDPAGGGLWTATRPVSGGPLGSPSGGPGTRGWGSRAPGVAGAAGGVGTATGRRTAVGPGTAAGPGVAGGADA
jgi:hypothetical protein